MTDGMLMQKVKEGDLSQAALLFHRYHRKIYHYIGKMSGDYHAADDLTQTVFEKLIVYRNSFEPDQNFEGWIYRIAKNTFLDHISQLKKKPTHVEMEDHALNLIHDEHNDRIEQEEKINKAMAELSVEYREVLILTRYQKLKYQEVAKILNTTESNIKVKVYRAIEKLRSHYFTLNPYEHE